MGIRKNPAEDEVVSWFTLQDSKNCEHNEGGTADMFRPLHCRGLFVLKNERE